MGCVSTRERVSKEEQAIMLMENQLEYFKSNSMLVDGVIRKYSNDGKINKSQWEDIRNFLEIKVHNTSMCPLTEEFYGNLMKNEMISMEDLLVLGILLSNGLARQKARLIFEIFDKQCCGELSRTDLEGIIDRIAWFSVKLLPKLVHNSTNPPVSSAKIKKYSKELMALGEETKKALVGHILKKEDSISILKFAKIFDNDENGQLLTPHGFRNYTNKAISLI